MSLLYNGCARFLIAAIDQFENMKTIWGLNDRSDVAGFHRGQYLGKFLRQLGAGRQSSTPPSIASEASENSAATRAKSAPFFSCARAASARWRMLRLVTHRPAVVPVSEYGRDGIHRS